MEREEIKHASWNLCSRPGSNSLGEGQEFQGKGSSVSWARDPRSQPGSEGASSGVLERGVIRCFLCLLKSKKLISFGQIMSRSTCNKVYLLTF